MKIKCKHCGYSEEVNAAFFVKIIGGAVSGFGFWAWVVYLFAGTGFALSICVAIIIGGTAIVGYSDKIVKWIIDKKYPCEKCGSVKWEAFLD